MDETETDVDQQLLNAIQNRSVIEFDYGGHHRIAEPHVYGRSGNVDQLLVYQVGGGSSSGGLPQWRRVDVPGMNGLSVLEDTFPDLGLPRRGYTAAGMRSTRS